MQRWLGCSLTVLGAAVLVGTPAPAAAELKVGVSGYVKLDVMYGDKLTGTFPAPAPGDVPFDDNKEKDHGQTILDARQSRLRATFSDEVAGVKISGRIEADFFDLSGTNSALTSNSRFLRLRHAFVRGDHPSGFSLLAGQYWSLFMNESVAAYDTVDFNGPAGQLFARQPQLRVGYKVPVAGSDLVFEADVEKHSTQNLGSTSVDERLGEGQDVPLFSGKVAWLSKTFQIEGAVAFADTSVTLVGGRRLSETAWAAQVSAQVNLGPFSVYGHYHRSDGLNRLANGDFPSDVVLVGSSLETVETDGFYVGASYNLTKNTRFNAIVGYAKADEIPGAFTGDSLEQHRSLHVNVIHKFWDRWQVGLEYQRFEVEAFNDREGDVNIVRGAIWYFF